ncbi:MULTISPECIES: acyltransferase [unclassified Mesorhizobium]|uniref:acyltransferase family protein n=1 Tax=unclassified Mesorhizobium TaxID=325217 RepID=UPI00109353A6|nr:MULTISPECIES: acyltransferase [unclassified Mesorhizobium]TGT85100.1 acyltransferase [Mesorhizobium sp. M8A.F.Ca.ET.161.01.1.1]TGV39043.1 acyltransferase [Mesorhizobium sp. M8A.F.Ca.ET.142.01.1.1]
MGFEIDKERDAKASNLRIELPGLLAMRCYAALSIVLLHLIELPKLQIPSYLWFVPTHFGNGVPLFYIVSAFGLFVGYSGKIETRQELRNFYLRRFLRIAPLFYFMMLFYIPFCLAMWGTTIPLSQFASSALFVFNFVPNHVTGFVMASWSIGVEMAFYAIFPLLVFAITGLARSVVFLAVTVFLAANWALAFQGTKGGLALFGSFSLMAHLFYFAAGIAGYHVWLRLRRASPLIGRLVFAASLLTIAGLICFSSQIAVFFETILGTSSGAGVRTAWATTLAGAVVGVSLYPQRWFVNPAAKLFGNASFSIYLWHPVVIVILDRLGLYRTIYAFFGGVSLPLVGSVMATLAALIPLSLLSYRYIERPGMAWEKRPTLPRPA